MKRSTDRILTTHTGSLPRPDALVQLMWAKEDGQPFDAAALARRISQAVREVVVKQAETGLDIIDDGEVSKPSYSTYVKDRLSGFEGPSIPGFPNTDMRDYPGYASRNKREPSHARSNMPSCNGPVGVKDAEAVKHDIANLKQALGGVPHEDVFMTSVSPGQIARFQQNRYYPSHEAYIWALAEAMRPEYHAIIDAGFVLQLDCPDLAMLRHTVYLDKSLADFRRIIAINVAALNHAVRDLPPGRMRMHVCWGATLAAHHTVFEL